VEITMAIARSTRLDFLSHSASSPGGVLAVLRRILSDYSGARSKRAEMNETMTALAQLDDAGLADIGLHRSQIVSVAQRVARQAKAR
jgi:uncharacterized protein YjiS (DUF1127 family)